MEGVLIGLIYNGEEILDDTFGLVFDGDSIGGLEVDGITVHVSPPDAPAEILPESITVRAIITGEILPGIVTIARKQVLLLTVEILPANATNKSFTCTHSKPSVATVEKTGENTAELTGVAAGSLARIEFSTVNGITAGTYVTVMR